jgi:hypothetical protein
MNSKAHAKNSLQSSAAFDEKNGHVVLHPYLKLQKSMQTGTLCLTTQS